jgi:hypothetical protein
MFPKESRPIGSIPSAAGAADEGRGVTGSIYKRGAVYWIKYSATVPDAGKHVGRPVGRP